ncbi:MAG: DUF4405 domain-containing protein [Prevotellaceae bacterium]|nr:DUF4405 domain-containing protein [Prevotellaceae bacterium]
MKPSSRSPFNKRRRVSLWLFFTMCALVLTGVLIQTFEALEKEFPAHLFTAIHVVAGVIFTVFSIFHVIYNWRALKNYLRKND